MDELAPLERAVLERATSSSDPISLALRAQLQGLRVSRRDFTGHGFFTELVVLDGADPLPGRENVSIDCIDAQVDGLSHGAGFILFVRNGALATLEGFSYDEPWPVEARNFRILHTRQPQLQRATSETL